MPPEQGRAEALALLKQVEREHGKQAAAAVHALASMLHSIGATERLLAGSNEARVVPAGALSAVHDLWVEAENRITRALIAPLLGDLEPARAVALSGRLRQCARYLAERPPVERH